MPHYAVKSNPHPEIVKTLVDAGSNFDIASVNELKLLLSQGATPDRLIFANPVKKYEEITTDEIIRGYVISNDEAGNFYKQLVLQDETGGIEMRIDIVDLFSVYPPGRQVYVRLKGLWLGDFNGLVQLGAAVTGSGNDRELVRIPETIASQILVTGTFGNVVPPNVLTINQLNNNLIKKLSNRSK